MSAQQVVALKNLEFRWPGQPRPCLQIPAFSVTACEHVFLYGPSGAGKSTLLALIGGILQPQTGSLRLLDKDLQSLSSAARDRLRADHIGFIFQQFNLLPYLSVRDNVLLACRFSARRHARAVARAGSIQTEAERLLQHLDLAPALWRQQVNRLSVGQQQRVAAARALLGQPELIVADEPTSALDASRQQAFIDLLLREAAEAGSTVLFVSHDRRLAGHFSHELDLQSLNMAPGEVPGEVPA